MFVSGWKSGKFGAGRRPVLGLRIGRKNAKEFFEKDWNLVFIEIDSGTIPVKVTNTFWTTCPELRSPDIGRWMRKHGLVPWPEGRPPKMLLTPLRRNRFRLGL
jgi:hypothetical protein